MRIEVVQEITGRFMRIAVEEEREDFGTEMLKYNDVEGIMGPQIYMVDKEPRFMYEVGGMISVSELFKKTIFTSKELLGLVGQIIDILSQCPHYFLEEKNLLLMSDYMFYDEKKGQLRIAYLDGFDSDVGAGISKILEDFMDIMDHCDKELAFLVYGMHRVTRAGHFSLKKLSSFIEENSQKEAERPAGRCITEKEAGEKYKIEKSRPHREEITLPEESPKKQVKRFWKGSLFVLAGIFLVVIVIRSGLLVRPVTGGLDVKKAVVFVLVFVVGEGYLFGKEGIRKKEKFGRAKSTDQMAGVDKTALLMDAGSEETVVLDRQDDTTWSWYVNLVPEDWQREEIKIRKSPFFIGKDATKTDGVIEDKEISRLHAKFIIEGNNVFVVDQDSTNGTFVEGKQLIPWERCRIKSGDMIGISSIYYKVEIYQ